MVQEWFYGGAGVVPEQASAHGVPMSPTSPPKIGSIGIPERHRRRCHADVEIFRFDVRDIGMTSATSAPLMALPSEGE